MKKYDTDVGYRKHSGSLNGTLPTEEDGENTHPSPSFTNKTSYHLTSVAMAARSYWLQYELTFSLEWNRMCVCELSSVNQT